MTDLHVGTDHTWTANSDLLVYDFLGGGQICVCVFVSTPL